MPQIQISACINKQPHLFTKAKNQRQGHESKENTRGFRSEPFSFSYRGFRYEYSFRVSVLENLEEVPTTATVQQMNFTVCKVYYDLALYKHGIQSLLPSLTN
ncbi:hypothetical protein TIFTF001_007598 [Ficus carica]|uniref:Uncharacterized protein n=1 Tax=Ficus carica TaxID=3494 RepID=A0AA87ZQG6_FICCA|nr:hypothetical protein TIFTF001_007598 [Ficus carica]